jgi:hypothetical protein
MGKGGGLVVYEGKGLRFLPPISEEMFIGWGEGKKMPSHFPFPFENPSIIKTKGVHVQVISLDFKWIH